MSNFAISVKNLHKSFHVGDQDIEVLKNINLSIVKDDFSIIFGPSGCGKSTLLHTILGLEPPTKGIVLLLDNEIYKETEEDNISDFRKKHIGMVYQQANWIKSLNVIENISFPLLILGIDKKTAIQKAKNALEKIKMFDWAYYYPTELSSGQQQKIALTRAIISEPEIIIADEPTGNLDYESGQEIMTLLQDMNKEQKRTVIMVTHDLEYLKYSKTAIQMLDGEIVGIFDEKNKEKLKDSIKSKRFLGKEDSLNTNLKKN